MSYEATAKEHWGQSANCRRPVFVKTWSLPTIFHGTSHFMKYIYLILWNIFISYYKIYFSHFKKCISLILGNVLLSFHEMYFSEIQESPFLVTNLWSHPGRFCPHPWKAKRPAPLLAVVPTQPLTGLQEAEENNQRQRIYFMSGQSYMFYNSNRNIFVRLVECGATWSILIFFL